MSGSISYTDIEYTDDFSVGLDDAWVVNQPVNKYQWAQTSEPEFTRIYSNVCRYTAADSGLGKLEFFSENSKYGTKDSYSWDDSNKTAKELSAGISKADIFICYGSEGPNTLGTRSVEKPLYWDKYLLSQFKFTNFIGLIKVDYYDTVDNNGDFYKSFWQWDTHHKVDLKTYNDLKEASGLSDEDFYLRHPIYGWELIGYYKDTSDIWQTTEDLTGDSLCICLSRQTVNNATREKTIVKYDGSVNGSPSALNKTSTVFVTPGFSNLGNISRTYYYDDIKTTDPLNARNCYDVEGIINLNDIGFVELTIEEGVSYVNEDDTSKYEIHKSDNELLGIIVSPIFSGEDEDGVNITPFWTVEQIMKRTALFGIYFTTDEDLIGTDLDNPYDIPPSVFLGYMDDNGWTNGDYAEGTAIRTFNSSNKNISDINDTPYNPSSEPAGSHTETKNSDIWQTGGFTHYYLLSDLDVSELQIELGDSWRAAVANAGQYLISLNQIPYLFYDLINTATKGFMEIGDYTTHDAKGSRIIDSIAELDYTDIPIPGGNSFLDYHPYTSYSLYIPYCGIVDLPTDSIVGTTINVKYVFDFKSGAIIGEVFSKYGELLVTSKGNMFSGENLEVNSSLLKGIQTALAISGSVMNGVGSSISSIGSAALAATGKSAKNADMKSLSVSTTMVSGVLDVVQTTINALGKDYINIVTGDGNYTSFKLPQKCILFTKKITLADKDTVDIYAKTTGFRCELGGKIGKFKGYNVFNNYHLNVPCTSDEKELIDSWLRSGVIL